MTKRRNGSVAWKIWVPPNLALSVERLYLNPMTGKPEYGARSHLVTALLDQFMRATLQHEGQAIATLVNELVDRGRKLEENQTP